LEVQYSVRATTTTAVSTLSAMTKAERKVMIAAADRAAAPVANGTMSLPIAFTRRFS